MAHKQEIGAGIAPPLLATKLYRPLSRGKLVLRAHLFQQLNAGLQRKLTLISAPAGFGKTTLVTAWLQHLEQGQATAPTDVPLPQVAWLSLDDRDNDFGRFLTYAIAALGAILPGMGESALELLQAPQPPGTEALITVLINDLALLTRPLVLVLDDYHLVTNPAIHQAVTLLLENLPPSMHLILIGRADPPLPLARWRGRGELHELRQADLRFSQEEADAFLHEMIGRSITPTSVAQLNGRTEGWIAGLQMAALSLQHLPREDTARFIQAFTGSHRYILDYLLEEVWQRQPPYLQHFLLTTSVLDRLSGPLCDALLAAADPEGDSPSSAADSLAGTGSQAQEILALLEAANLFIVSLDDERHWYRYHRLFSDLLRQRLQQQHPERLARLHLRASSWFEEQGYWVDAVDHALAAEDYDRAAELVEQVAETLLMRSQVSTLLDWLQVLPQSHRQRRPHLCLYLAWAQLLHGEPVPVIRQTLQGISQPSGSLAAKVELVDAFLAIFEAKFERTAQLARQALTELEPHEIFWRSMANWFITIVAEQESSDFQARRALLDESARQGQDTGNVMVTVASLCNLARGHLRQGRSERAREIYEEALALATDDEGRPLPIGGKALHGLADLAWEQFDLERAAGYIEAAIERTSLWRAIAAFPSYMLLAYIRHNQGDWDGALAAMRQAETLAVEFEVTEWDDWLVAAYKARLHLFQGRPDLTVRWAEERGLLQQGQLVPFTEATEWLLNALRGYEYLVLVRWLLIENRAREALHLLVQLQPHIEPLQRLRLALEVDVLRALSLQAVGEETAAQEMLQRTLARAEPGGFIRVFVENGSALHPLLTALAQNRDRSQPFIEQLLAIIAPQTPAPSAGSPRSQRAQPLVESLTKRELEVLVLIAAGLSNREIGQKLFLSLPTVKWHTSNIYGKLGVKNRTTAVNRARTLDLLPSD